MILYYNYTIMLNGASAYTQALLTKLKRKSLNTCIMISKNHETFCIRGG